MLNIRDIMETITMIQEENLDIRTITMGMSLLDCADADIDRSCTKVYEISAFPLPPSLCWQLSAAVTR